jgi:hypothetical protein
VLSTRDHPQRAEQQQRVIELRIIQALERAQIALHDTNRLPRRLCPFGGNEQRFVRKVNSHAVKAAFGKIHERPTCPAAQIDETPRRGKPASDDLAIEIQ